MSTPSVPMPPNPRRRWRQFSLRTLFAAVTSCAAVLAVACAVTWQAGTFAGLLLVLHRVDRNALLIGCIGASGAAVVLAGLVLGDPPGVTIHAVKSIITGALEFACLTGGVVVAMRGRLAIGAFSVLLTITIEMASIKFWP